MRFILVFLLLFGCTHELPLSPHDNDNASTGSCEEIWVETGLIIIEYPDGRVDTSRSRIKINPCDLD